MNTYADKIQESKNQAVANEVSQKRGGSESSFQFVDNRPEIIAQRERQGMTTNSPRIKQLRAFQEMANNSPQAKQAVQLKAMLNSYALKQQKTTQIKENKTSLPDNLKSGIENISGYSMDDVKVNYNSDKPAQLNAHAYAQGTGVYLGSGQEKHLPHEAWQVVKQKQGRMKPNVQLKREINVNDDVGLEKEADVMGEKAAQLTEYEPSIQKQPIPNSSELGMKLIQRMTFSRFKWKQSPLKWGWKYNAKEKNLLAIEKKLGKSLEALKPYTKGMFGDDILKIAGKFHFLSVDDYKESQYDAVLKEMSDLLTSAEDITDKVSSADLNDNHLKSALTTNQGQGPLAKEVVIELLKVYAALPDAMNTRKNKKLIKGAIYPVARQSGGFYNEDMAASTTKFARTQGALLTKNFNQLNARIISAWPSVKQRFNIDGNLKEIELTGSDFHNSGQQVAIVESTTGKKIVYKPRSISPDTMLAGENSAFNDLNKLSNGSVQLPTMKFGETKDKDGTFSFVEYQQKVEEQSVAQVRKHYERYGELVVASKLLGVNDLHNENIMSKSGTPTIIDAETAFLPFVMNAQSFARTEMSMSLNSVKKHMSTEAAENFFYTPQEKANYDQQINGDFVSYVTNLRRQDLNGQKNYMAYFERGMDNVINLVKTKKEDIIKILLGRMKNTEHIRVVPFKTQDFQDSITQYRGYLVAGRQDRADTIVKNDVTKMKDAIKLKGFSIITSDWEPTVTSKVGKALKADYEAEDTPILHFEPAANELLFHGQEVGFSENWEEPENFIESMVNRIANAKKDKIKADLNVGN